MGGRETVNLLILIGQHIDAGFQINGDVNPPNLANKNQINLSMELSDDTPMRVFLRCDRMGGTKVPCYFLRRKHIRRDHIVCLTVHLSASISHFDSSLEKIIQSMKNSLTFIGKIIIIGCKNRYT